MPTSLRVTSQTTKLPKVVTTVMSPKQVGPSSTKTKKSHYAAFSQNTKQTQSKQLTPLKRDENQSPNKDEESTDGKRKSKKKASGKTQS